MNSQDHPQPCMDSITMRFMLHHLAAFHGNSDHPDCRGLLDRLELHIDNCEQCQAHIAWLANGVPQPEVLALAELTQPG